jgi:hypothetical protein
MSQRMSLPHRTDIQSHSTSSGDRREGSYSSCIARIIAMSRATSGTSSSVSSSATG